MSNTYVPLRVPFAQMSFTPDVPSNALSATEYNNGYNVETDVRGIKKVDGEQSILSSVPGNIIFIEGGFRNGNLWSYIIATSAGIWYLVNQSGIAVITPSSPFATSSTATGYSYAGTVPITGSWVGQVFFINDGINPPMYFYPSSAVSQIGRAHV